MTLTAEPDSGPRRAKAGRAATGRKPGGGRPPARPGRGKRLLLRLAAALLVLGLLGSGGVLYVIWHYSRDLPSFSRLQDYEPPTTTRIHAGDGRLIAEYAREKRVFVPVKAMPQGLINGFIAAEDKNFYQHHGIDPMALLRAVATNIPYYFEGRRPVGASTITQQVAKNFLLTNEVSLERKIREALLAVRIERSLSKERILELYLNEIYLGGGAYGVAAAALSYFDKSLHELTTAEIAYLAALPKAPNNYHPVRNYEAAITRRNWVITRMEEDGYLDRESADAARAEPLRAVLDGDTAFLNAGYFVEEVRREMAARHGEAGVDEGGFSVRTTLDPKLQQLARDTLRNGLEAYDRRHGYRGPLTRMDRASLKDWQETLSKIPVPQDMDNWQTAVVLGLQNSAATIGFAGGGKGSIPLEELKWTRQIAEDGSPGPAVIKPSDALSAGDVVLVEALGGGRYGLRQIPAVEGALAALDPHTGRVLAMAGGWSYARSQFNRATQAWRQPGSAFKPFVYLTALDNGYTPATMILDAPFVMDQAVGQDKWSPENFSNVFYGPSPMRVGIEKSRNLMTVRLAQAIGMDKVADTAERFGITDRMPPLVAMSLGSGETTLLRLTAAYGMIVNGGRQIVPTLVDRVQDRNGITVFRHDIRPCPDCQAPYRRGMAAPQIPDTRKPLTDPASAYQIVTMLEGVIQRGTAQRLRSINRPLAGKTGTTNDSRDAWFVGFSPDLVVGVFVGFDTPRPLGWITRQVQETGSSVAAPVFGDFMQQALAGKPVVPFRTPPDIRMVRIDARTGQLAGPDTRTVITEAFRAGTEPQPGRAAIFIEGGSGKPGLLPGEDGNSGTRQRGLY